MLLYLNFHITVTASAAEINETVNLMGGADHSVYQVYCKGIQTLNNGLNSLAIPTEENRYLQKHRMTCEGMLVIQ